MNRYNTRLFHFTGLISEQTLKKLFPIIFERTVRNKTYRPFSLPVFLPKVKKYDRVKRTIESKE